MKSTHTLNLDLHSAVAEVMVGSKIVARMTGLSVSTVIQRHIATSNCFSTTFPRPFRAGGGRGKLVWRLSEVVDFVETTRLVVEPQEVAA